MRLTAEDLRLATQCSTRSAERYVEPINITLDRFDISTEQRVAAFLGQVAHESSRFDRVIENLNYSSMGLAATWPSRFRDVNGSPTQQAIHLHRKPEEIANVVYANRMGNGPYESGDGWKYRGRGLIQITGKANYTLCGEALGVDLVAQPEVLEFELYSALSAGWYWDKHGLNQLADKWNLDLITRRINGGTHGLADRIAISERAITKIQRA